MNTLNSSFNGQSEKMSQPTSNCDKLQACWLVTDIHGENLDLLQWPMCKNAFHKLYFCVQHFCSYYVIHEGQLVWHVLEQNKKFVIMKTLPVKYN